VSPLGLGIGSPAVTNEAIKKAPAARKMVLMVHSKMGFGAVLSTETDPMSVM